MLESLSAEKRLLEKEKAMMQEQNTADKALGFIPDHLEFGCDEGVWIFKVSEFPLESFIVVRGK